MARTYFEWLSITDAAAMRPGMEWIQQAAAASRIKLP